MNETLTCKSCENQFTRAVTRGRKPTQCPDCKERGLPKPAEAKPEVVEGDDPEKAYIDPNPETAYDMSFIPDGEREIAYHSKVLYEHMNLNGGQVAMGNHVKIKGDRNTYRFRGLLLGKAGMSAELAGVSKDVEGKFYSVYPGRVTKKVVYKNG